MTSDVYPLAGYKLFGNLNLRVNEENPDKLMFVARDVAVALGYKKPQNAVARHCKQAIKMTAPKQGGQKGGAQFLTLIPESDVYRLMTHSNLDAAQEFERRVFEEILPTIRKHGVYAAPDTLDKMLADPDFGIKMLETVKAEREKSAALEAEIVEQMPAVEYADTTTNGMQEFQIRNVAKLLGRSLKELTSLLLKEEFLYERKRGNGGVTNFPTKQTQDDGYVVLYPGWSYALTQKGLDYVQSLVENQEAF